MPVYTYKCTKCNSRFNHTQEINTVPLANCFKCDGLLERLISKNIGVRFKGKGFYSTDNKK